MKRFSFKAIARESWDSSKSLKRMLVIVFAYILLAVSIIGIFIPLVPGRLIAIPPLLLLSIYSPTLYNYVKRKTDGHPKIESRFDRIRNWVIRRLH